MKHPLDRPASAQDWVAFGFAMIGALALLVAIFSIR